MHFLFIVFCTNMPFHTLIQVESDIRTSTCCKIKCIFVYIKLAFTCAWDKAVYFEAAQILQHKGKMTISTGATLNGC